MAHFIIHYEGAYNVWSTVVDAPLFDGALTLDQLRQVEPVTDDRLVRAHATGCSAIYGMTLDECMAGNRAGPNETELPPTEFIAKYLTFRASIGDPPAPQSTDVSPLVSGDSEANKEKG